MSAWELIEQRIDNSVVPVFLTTEEYSIVQEALSAFIRSRLNEGSAWSVFEQLAEAASATIPVKGMTKQQVDMLRKKFPELAAQVREGNTGFFLMLEPKVWENVRKQLQVDQQFAGLAPVEDLVTKITDSLALVQGPAMARRGLTKSPTFQGKVTDPTANAKVTGFNSPDVKGDVPGRFQGSATRPTPAPQKPIPSVTHDPAALGGPSTPFANKAKVAAQDAAGSAGAQQAGSTDWSKGKTTVLDPKTQKKTDDMEDPSQWSLENRRRR